METANPASGLQLVVNSQTPLVRFKDEAFETGRVAGDQPLRMDQLQPEDYKFTTGGVTRMLFPLLKRWLAGGHLEKAEWVALAAGRHAPVVEHDGVTLSFVAMDGAAKKGYAEVKEKLWALLNSNPNAAVTQGLGGLRGTAWDAFDAYQERSAHALQQASDRMGRADLLYIHDFQQVGVARAWTGHAVPKLFHLHTPFPSVLPEAWSDYLLSHLSRYDAVVVSTHRYAQNLRQAGLTRPLHVIPPFIDPDDYTEATAGDVRRFRERFGIAESDRIILNVGRMDPIKAQDRLIRALPQILREVPEARLVLVGNGSFSSSKTGGLGLSKGHLWRAHLENLTKELGVTDRVTFTGHLSDEEVPAAYAACDVFSLPSTREGFGLAVIEAWQKGKPVVVSDRAGVADLVVEGENGIVRDCGDPALLAEACLTYLRDPDRARREGEAGEATSREATLPVGARRLRNILESLVEEGPYATV